MIFSDKNHFDYELKNANSKNDEMHMQHICIVFWWQNVYFMKDIWNKNIFETIMLYVSVREICSYDGRADLHIG